LLMLGLVAVNVWLPTAWFEYIWSR
jgi:hypothetical protein